ncbi:unnamed protein product [Alopecurus aequalis]
MEAALVGDRLGHKRVDPERGSNSGDFKRPCEGSNGLHNSTMEMGDDDDVKDWEPEPNALDFYREFWIESYACHGISFEDETDLPPMRNTDGPMISNSSGPMPTMQVLYVKVTQITDALQWPLLVYGDIAVRDSMDHKRNFLFHRSRDQCQKLTSLQDAVLELTGPSRAVMLMDPHAFEIDLKVRDKESPSEDKALSYNAFIYNNIAHASKASYARTEVVPDKHSTIEVRFAHLAGTVEATIEVAVVSGSHDFKARFTARTASIDEDMVLLDSFSGKVDVTDTGNVVLKRRIVTVEERGKLLLGVEAAESNSVAVQKWIKLTPRCALRSQGYFDLGFSKLRVVVAWSLLP